MIFQLPFRDSQLVQVAVQEPEPAFNSLFGILNCSCSLCVSRVSLSTPFSGFQNRQQPPPTQPAPTPFNSLFGIPILRAIWSPRTEAIFQLPFRDSIERPGSCARVRRAFNSLFGIHKLHDVEDKLVFVSFNSLFGIPSYNDQQSVVNLLYLSTPFSGFSCMAGRPRSFPLRLSTPFSGFFVFLMDVRDIVTIPFNSLFGIQGFTAYP